TASSAGRDPLDAGQESGGRGWTAAGVDDCSATAGPLVGAARRDHPRQALARRGQKPGGLFPPATGLWVVGRGFGHNIFERCQSTPRRAEGPLRLSVVSSLHCMNDPQPEGQMASHIERREFLATLGGAAVVWPLAAHAQQPGVALIGLL